MVKGMGNIKFYALNYAIMKNFNAKITLLALAFTISACGGNSSKSGEVSKDGETGTATDQQGQNFETITIGSQVWMAENLNVEQFQNGEAILKANNWEEWSKAGKEQKPAWCYYEFKDENGKKYGKLYNWYAVNDTRGLAPKEWKIPSEKDWKQLENHLGELAGKSLKSATGWNNDGNGDNASGFNALPAGAMNPSSMNMGDATYWWVANEVNAGKAPTRFLGYWGETLDKGNYGKENGFSVRCLSIVN